MNEQETRELVSKAYTDALKRSTTKSAITDCCTTISTHAGYSSEKAQFAEAAQSSFGCGNPLAFAAVKTGDVVVDLGSGAGFDLLIASEQVGETGRVIGVDMIDDMIDAARKNTERAGVKNVEVRKGLIERLPVEDASADWVISNCVINLSPEKDRVFNDIYRVLKPGGRFSVSDVVARDLPDWIREKSRAYTACIAGAISEDEYFAGLDAAGLVDVEVRDKMVYSKEQLRAIIDGELTDGSAPEDFIERACAQVEGEVWSARFVGRRPHCRSQLAGESL